MQMYKVVLSQGGGHPSNFKISLLLQAATLHAITVKTVTPFRLSRTTPSLGKLPYQDRKLSML